MPMMQKTLAEVLTVARASAGTVFDAAGNLVTVPANQPRFDYDPVSRVFRGLLVEEQRTNLLINSANGFLTLVSGGGAVVVSRAQHLAPDGTMTASRCTTTRGSEYGLVGGNVLGLSVNTDYTYSVWLKSAAGTQTIAFYNNNTGMGSIVIDEVWRRYSMPNARRSDAGSFYRWMGSAGSFASADFYIWGEQWEAGAFPTSYIPTTTASATRAADVVQVIDGLWRGNSAHTLYVEASRRQIQPAPLTACFLSMQAADGSGGLLAIESGASSPSQQRLRVRSGGVDTVVLPTGLTAQPDVVYRMVATMSQGRYAFAQNGMLVGASSVSDAIPSLAVMRLGSVSTGNFLNGHIRSVQYADRVLSDADLIAVSLKGLAA